MNEATRQRDEELAKLIEQSRQLGPMTSEEQREQRISWVYGNCKLSNPDVTREMVENAVDFGPTLTHMDGHLAAPPRPAPGGEPSPHIIPEGLKITDQRRRGTGANLDFKHGISTRKLNIRPLSDPTPTQPDTFCDACYDQEQGFGKCPDHIVSPQPAAPTYINPLASLRRERKVKSGKAAKLLGISRQRLYVVEHATKPLRCMDRLLAKAAEVWPVLDETAKGDDDASK